MNEAKPFDIPKREVWEAFKRVKANQGAAGVDGQSIRDFEARLAGNLYKLWNRLSSGSYMPPPVRRVDIPKANGGTRPLGIPTVADRIAQEVVRRYLEPLLEPKFHADSMGIDQGVRRSMRSGRRVSDAGATTGFVDLDIKGFFDSIDHGNCCSSAVRKHTQCSVGVALHRALAEGACDAGRMVNLISRDTGNAARWCDQPTAGQPVPALCVRCVAGTRISEVCRLSGTPTISSATAEASVRPWRCASVVERRFAECRIGAPSREDEGGLLQGHQPQPVSYPNCQFDFLGLYVSTAESEMARGICTGCRFFRQPAPRHSKQFVRAIRGWSFQTRSDKAARRSGPDVQPVHPRLDQLLQSLL